MRKTLLTGIMLRLILMPITAHPFDVYNSLVISKEIVEKGPSLNYHYLAPLWYYFMVPLAYLYNWLSKISAVRPLPIEDLPSRLNPYPQFDLKFIPDPLFCFIIKVPMLVSDILVAWILFELVRNMTRNNEYAEKAFGMWFLNPYLIWISCGWGKMDSLAALFCMLSLYLMHKLRLRESALSLVSAIGLKIYPLTFVAPLLIFFRKFAANRLRDLGLFFTYFAIGALLMALIFADGLLDAPSRILSSSEGFRYGWGLTYWSFLLVIEVSKTATILASTLLMVVAFTVVLAKSAKLSYRDGILDLTIAELSCIIAIYVSYRVINEQYFVWALPYIVLLVVHRRLSPKFRIAPSLIALLYSVTNLALPFFFLPIYPWAGGILYESIILLNVDPRSAGEFRPHPSIGSITLAILGSVFSILMLSMLKQILFKAQNPQKLCARGEYDKGGSPRRSWI